MKVIVIGGVAAGTKVAAKLKRRDRSAAVRVLTKSRDISYAGCGIPYLVGGDIADRDGLIVNSPDKFAALTGVEVVTGCTVTAVHPERKTVDFCLSDGTNGEENYDKLVIASGAEPVLPSLPGVQKNGVFTVRTPDDAVGIRDYVRQNGCKTAVVVGAGFIGLEMAENLQKLGLSVTLLDAAETVLANALDRDMAGYVAKKLTAVGMRVLTSVKLLAVEGESRAAAVTTDAGRFPADVVIMSVGVRPATDFLNGSGIVTERGAVVVDAYMQTNLADIYAVGDCALVSGALTGKPQWSAMGSTANITGRMLAKSLTGEPKAYKGCLGTGVIKLPGGLNCGRTGLTEAAAGQAGFDAVSALCVLDDKAHYYPDADSFVIKLVADRTSRRLLGAQIVGTGAVDKMTDIAVTGISLGADLEHFEGMDFAYAPPFSTAISPFVTAVYVLENKLSGELESFTPEEYAAGAAEEYTVIDAQPRPSIPGAMGVDLTKCDNGIEGVGKEEKLLLVCTRGKRAYFLQNRLKHAGYTNTRVLEGGVSFNDVRVRRKGGKLSAEEIKRVKGLGCLRDKRFDDVFNVRVITRNGKLTSEKQHAVAEAAQRFGSGEVTMTTRLTLEIQGVCYDRLDALFAFLKEHGLETGGTGSLVRPVVSCKGTTCQFGLIDTFGLSEKLHTIFYEGYHGLTLPHKFKIAVGGCPNNCVKPDLNDLGIVGQRVPSVDLSKCRGCKVCQVENSCPIKAVQMQDGKIVMDTESCNHCGRCVNKCPFGAVGESVTGYKVYIGGRWGKKIAQGRPLTRIFMTEREVIEIVDRAIMLFREEGVTGERFADTVARLGFAYVNDKLLNGTFDKEKLMEKKVKGGATC